MKKYLPHILLSVIFIFLLFYLKETSYRRILKMAENIPEANLSTTPAVNTPEIKWVTYRDEKYGFEFQYPGDLSKISVSFSTISKKVPYKDRDIVTTLTIIGNVESIQYSYFTGSIKHNVASIPYKKEFIIIDYFGDISDQELTINFNQILSTFKLTESKSDLVSLKIYYHNPNLDLPNDYTCTANDYKEVLVSKTITPLKESINQLLSSFVSEDQKDYGTRVTNFKLKSAVINNGVAKLVFDDPEFYTDGGSCRLSEIQTSIEKTALQFPSVKKVEISGASFQL